MKCTNCGAEIADNSTFCTECGTGVTTAQAPVEQAPVAQQTYAPANTELTLDQIPAKFKPMGAWSYFGHSLLFSIPLVGFVFLIVFALGGTKNINKRNYARSYFCGLLLVAIIAIVTLVLFLIFGAATGVASEVTNMYY